MVEQSPQHPSDRHQLKHQSQEQLDAPAEAKTNAGIRASVGAIYVPTRDADDWRRLLADPEKHWRTGYSAKAIAHCWQEAAGFPDEIHSMLSNSGIAAFQQVERLLAFPEYQVALPGGRRPSQNDLFVLAKGLDRELISMMIEGKVVETFGPTLAEWSNPNAQPSEGKRERLSYITHLLGLPEPIGGTIRYQLLHRTASAMIEALRFNAKHAIMIVHSFSHDDRWFDDFSAFVALFQQRAVLGSLVHLGTVQGINLYAGWARGNPSYLQR